MKVPAVVFCLLLGAAETRAGAQSLPTAPPESAGMSSARLTRIGDALRREIDAGRIPGAVVAITRQGKLVYYEAFGFLDKTAGTPMRKDAIFSIASMTKPIFAVAAMSLHEEGRLLFDEPVGTYLPELRDRVVAVDDAGLRTEPAKRQPTIEDLLRHTSGFANRGWGESALHDRSPAALVTEPLTAAEYLARVAPLPLRYQPGTTWEYGPVSFDILGLVIERITGQSIDAVLQERVFGPLGMADTFFTIPSGKVSRQAKPLPRDPLTGAAQTIRDQTQPRPVDCGSGCLASTTSDYLAFAQMLLNGGVFNGTRVLGRKTVEYMTSDHTGPDVDLTRLDNFPSTPIYGYGFGLGVAVRRGTGLGGAVGSRGQFEWFGSQGTAFWVDPEEQLAIVFMVQTPGEVRTRYRQLLPGLVYQALVD